MLLDDSIILTGPNFFQEFLNDALVTPTGGIQTALADALANATGHPGGSNTQIQFNNNGVFGGISTTGTGNAVLATSASLTTPTIAGAAISGTLSGSPTFSGAPTFSGTVTHTALITGSATNSAVGLQFSGTRTWSGTQAAVGTGMIYSFTNQAGTTSTTNPIAYHFFSVASDTMAATSANATVSVVRADLTTGTGTRGLRDSVFGKLTINGTPGDGLTAVAGNFHAAANAAANAAGNHLFGINPTAGLTGLCTGSWTVVGDETDVACLAGSTPTRATGITVVLTAGHAVQGSDGIDSAFSVGSQASVTAGWDYGLRFGESGSPTSPMRSTATLFYVHQPSMSLGSGVDLTNGVFSGNAFASPGFAVDGSGNTTALKVNIGTSSGPTITTGSAAASGTQPKGSIYLRTGGGVGTTLYVSQGGGVWNAVAGV